MKREPTLIFSGLMPLFLELFEDDPARFVALTGRMRRLMKVGAVPTMTHSGRGSAQTFTREEAFRLAVAMELEQIGLKPLVAAMFCESHPDMMESPGPYSVDLLRSRSRSTGLTIDIPALRAVFERHFPRKETELRAVA